ncbi:helix-turn-helix domain-containing protein [Burkholderia pseudomallei]|uniref:helix-turn-helix domain-containing protein n=1 Tax=Burkholderia pseudomallei TaxID=28450 RepID=UPI000A1A0F1E|nr:helix-turn-helix domain-containing protein [Burkholderia pseudomallei]ARK50058.1 terminase [Burkholderia pseudomallei]
MSVKHLNQRQLADRWDVSEATLERWRSEGIGPVFLKLQGRVLYRLEDVEAYEAESLRKSTSERADVGNPAHAQASIGQ